MNHISFNTASKYLFYNPLSGYFTWRIKVKYSNSKIGDRAGYEKRKYRLIKIAQVMHAEADLAYLFMTGKLPPEGYLMDHKNRISNDNKWSNLELVTRSQNQQNQKQQSNNTSGVTGVSYRILRDRYQVGIKINNKEYGLGFFKNLDDAALARYKGEKKYGHYNPNGTSAYHYLKNKNLI